MIYEVLKTALESVDGLSARVFPINAIKNRTTPFVVYLLENQHQEMALDGPTGLFTAQYEVNVVHDSYVDIDALSSAISSALYALSGTKQVSLLVTSVTIMQGDPERYEDEVDLWRRPLTVILRYQEVD